jgi:predicted Co/Zn/Cd cation transporter (cation efflux family)
MQPSNTDTIVLSGFALIAGIGSLAWAVTGDSGYTLFSFLSALVAIYLSTIVLRARPRKYLPTALAICGLVLSLNVPILFVLFNFVVAPTR